jgi:excisionase family DNA binding protein
MSTAKQITLEQMPARMNTTQAASVLRCSNDHVAALIKSGRLPAINVAKTGVLYRIRRGDLAAFIEKGAA